MAYVSAPLVIAKLDGGGDVYLYEGAQLPDGLKDGEEARLIEAGLVAKGDAPGTEKAPAKKAAAKKSSK